MATTLARMKSTNLHESIMRRCIRKTIASNTSANALVAAAAAAIHWRLTAAAFISSMVWAATANRSADNAVNLLAKSPPRAVHRSAWSHKDIFNTLRAEEVGAGVDGGDYRMSIDGLIDTVLYVSGR